MLMDSKFTTSLKNTKLNVINLLNTQSAYRPIIV